MWKCFVLLCILHGTNARNSYVVILPSSIRPGLSLNIGVNILKADGNVTVTAALQTTRSVVRPGPVRPVPVRPGPVGPFRPLPFRFRRPSVIWTAKQTLSRSSIITRQGEPSTLNLEVPLILSPGSNYVIQMTGSGGLIFSRDQSIRLKKKSVSVFIQTDKGIYKPGQTVHLRTFAVFPDLKPFAGTFDIDISDPNSNKIKQWLNVRDESNIIARDLPLSEQPVMGKWKIRSTANGQVVERFFSVEDFASGTSYGQMRPSPIGIAVSKDRWKAFMDLIRLMIKDIEEALAATTAMEDSYTQCFDEHQNQESYLMCSMCNPNAYKDWDISTDDDTDN